MRSAKFIRVLAVCGIAAVGVGASAEGATIQAGGCSQSQVVSAINSAKDGDTVVVAAGSCTWTSTVTIDGKSITLQGAGIDSTIITDGIDSGGGAKPVLLSWITRNTGLSRLTGFTFNGGSSGGKSWTTIVAFYGSTASLRIDHTKIIPTRVKGIELSGYLRGVIDHNYWQLEGAGDSSPELGRRRRLRRQLLGAADELRQFAIHVRRRQPVRILGRPRLRY